MSDQYDTEWLQKFLALSAIEEALWSQERNDTWNAMLGFDEAVREGLVLQ